ncbi:MAG: CHAD domain-containing protein [Ferruginibacter sp.]|nr:CHAD domain-containing protein [Ferruginibacter sp.]
MKKMHDHTIAGYVDELKNYANKTAPDFALEDIHHFRTNTKKLRSVLRLNGHDKKLLGHKFLKLYHIAGDLRNAQVMLAALAKKGDRLPGLSLWLSTYIGHQVQAWDKHYSDNIFIKAGHSVLGQQKETLDLEGLRSFFKAHVSEVASIAKAAAPADEELHTIRKRIKDLVYVRQWCRHNWPDGWAATRRFSLTALQPLADVAGDYNDQRTGLDLLAAYLAYEQKNAAIRVAKVFERRQRKAATRSKAILVSAVRRFATRFQSAKDAKA